MLVFFIYMLQPILEEFYSPLGVRGSYISFLIPL